MKKDIETKADIALLIDTFYSKVRNNEIIGYIFNDIARVDWEHHLPVMYDFWESVLFHTGPYAGNPMVIHKNLHERHPLTAAHFSEWLRLFRDTVDELFEGNNAEIIKQRAQSIAMVMQLKITRPDIPVTAGTPKPDQ
jgi:hemoglobin